MAGQPLAENIHERFSLAPCSSLVALAACRAAIRRNPTTPGPSHVIVPHSKEAARNGEASLIELRECSLLLMYGAHQ